MSSALVFEVAEDVSKRLTVCWLLKASRVCQFASKFNWAGVVVLFSSTQNGDCSQTLPSGNL